MFSFEFVLIILDFGRKNYQKKDYYYIFMYILFDITFFITSNVYYLNNKRES